MLVISEFKRRGKFSFKALENRIESLKNQYGPSKLFVLPYIFQVLIANDELYYVKGPINYYLLLDNDLAE